MSAANTLVAKALRESYAREVERVEDEYAPWTPAQRVFHAREILRELSQSIRLNAREKRAIAIVLDGAGR